MKYTHLHIRKFSAYRHFYREDENLEHIVRWNCLHDMDRLKLNNVTKVDQVEMLQVFSIPRSCLQITVYESCVDPMSI